MQSFVRATWERGRKFFGEWFSPGEAQTVDRVARRHVAVANPKTGRKIARALYAAHQQLYDPQTAPGALKGFDFTRYQPFLIYMNKPSGTRQHRHRRQRVIVGVREKEMEMNAWKTDPAAVKTMEALTAIVHDTMPDFEIVAPPRPRRGFRIAPALSGREDAMRTYPPYRRSPTMPPYRHVGGDRYIVFIKRRGRRSAEPRSVTIQRNTGEIIRVQD